MITDYRLGLALESGPDDNRRQRRQRWLTAHDTTFIISLQEAAASDQWSLSIVFHPRKEDKYLYIPFPLTSFIQLLTGPVDHAAVGHLCQRLFRLSYLIGQCEGGQTESKESIFLGTATALSPCNFRRQKMYCMKVPIVDDIFSSTLLSPRYESVGGLSI